MIFLQIKVTIIYNFSSDYILDDKEAVRSFFVSGVGDKMIQVFKESSFSLPLDKHSSINSFISFFSLNFQLLYNEYAS